MRTLLCTLSALAALVGCTGQIEEPLGTPVGPGPAAPASSLPDGPAVAEDDVDVPAIAAKCLPATVKPGRAPLRRLTRFEYNNTVLDLLGDTTQPATALPSEELGNGFGNDADALSVSSLLAEQYGTVAAGIAERATATPAALAKLLPCTSGVTTATEPACIRSFIEGFVPRAYRRPLASAETDELVALASSAREGATLAVAIATVIEAVLQGPDFLYRPEFGVADRVRPELRRPSPHEMATRLSYLFWGTAPDAAQLSAAQMDALLSDQGVLARAREMLADPRSRPVVRFFFDNLLPLSGLSDLERDKAEFPSFSSSIGRLMREETQRFLEYEIFESAGSWASLMTAPYTFVNEALARFYGLPGVTGEAFRKVPLDTAQRLGLLTQGGIMAGTTHSNTTNPVVRGSFVSQKLLCRTIPLPTGDILAQIKPPDPYSGKTARERFSAHSQNPVCASCHRNMDPIGFALENYDPVGLFRSTENGVTIDASGALPGRDGTLSGPIELAQALAESEDARACFASHWLTFAYGRGLGAEDECAKQKVLADFKTSGHRVKDLLLALTQTHAFLYLPGKQ